MQFWSLSYSKDVIKLEKVQLKTRGVELQGEVGQTRTLFPGAQEADGVIL